MKTGRHPAALFRSERLSRNVVAVHFDDVRADWEKWILLSSDRHHDSGLCRRDLELEHLNEARKRGALIADFGDLFDGMQSPDDKRQNKSELRGEDKGRNYLDRLVQNAAGFYSPYAPNFVMIGRGNHETAILQRYGHDLTSALVSALNQRGGNVEAGWFGGWIFFRFHIQKTLDTTIRLKYFHGAGGGGAVTRGVIQTNRQQVYLPDADIICNGHTHDQWYVVIARERVSQRGIVSKDLTHHIRISGYKDAYTDGAEGWEVERAAPPKPTGAVWLRFWHRSSVADNAKINFDVVSAAE